MLKIACLSVALLFVCNCTIKISASVVDTGARHRLREERKRRKGNGGPCPFDDDSRKAFYMRKTIIKLAALGAALGSLSVAAPAIADDTAAAAEEEASGPFDLTATVGVVSDYRFRGVSLSDKDPAIQGGLTVSHESGFYAGVWGSNIADNPGDDLEVDLFAGFSGGETITYDIGATYYLYPGFSDANYVEFIGKLGTTVGPATIGGIVAYAPSQDGTGNQDNLYIGANASVALPNSPVSVTGSIGHEDGAFGDNKLDWSLGLTATATDYLSVSASYVDTNRRLGGLGKAGAVFSATLTF